MNDIFNPETLQAIGGMDFQVIMFVGGLGLVVWLYKQHRSERQEMMEQFKEQHIENITQRSKQHEESTAAIRNLTDVVAAINRGRR